MGYKCNIFGFMGDTLEAFFCDDALYKLTFTFYARGKSSAYIFGKIPSRQAYDLLGRKCYDLPFLKSCLFLGLVFGHARNNALTWWKYAWQTLGHLTFWMSPFGQWNHYLYSQASRSNYRGYLHFLKYLLLLYSSRQKSCRRRGLQTYNHNIFAKLLQLDVCKPTRLHHFFLL